MAEKRRPSKKMRIDKARGGGFIVVVMDGREKLQLRSRSYTTRAAAARFRQVLKNDFTLAGHLVEILG